MSRQTTNYDFNLIDTTDKIVDTLEDLNENFTNLDEILSNLVDFKYEVLSELPETGKIGTIYFIASGTSPNTYDEYIWVNNEFEIVGTTRSEVESMIGDYKALVESNYNSSNKVITGSGQTTDSLHYYNKRLNSVEADTLGQTVTTGAQLFNKDDSTKILAGYLSASTYTSNSNAKTLYIPCVAGQTYTISKISSKRFYVTTFADVPTNEAVGINEVHDNSATSLTITAGEGSNYLAVYYYLSTTDTLTEEEIRSSIMINTGDTALPYEQYTGGTASPSPDYPQAVKSLSGSVSVVVQNKNLYNGSYTADKNINSSGNLYNSTGVNSSDFVEVIFGKTYTVSGTDLYCVAFYDKNNTYISRIVLSYEYTLRTFTINNPDTKYIRFSGHATTWGSVILEVGSTATSHITHEEQTYPLTIPANMPLGKIGDYSNKIFKNTKDNPNYNSALTEGKWYWKKEWDKVVLSDTTNYSINTASNNTTRLAWPNGSYPVDSAGNILCNRLLYSATTWNADDEAIGENVNNNTIYIRISKTTIGTTEQEVAAWLSTHDLIAYYVIDTPTYTEITDTTLLEQLEALYQFMTYKNITNISITGGDIDGVLDFDYYVDDRVAMQSDIADLKAYVLSQGANI